MLEALAASGIRNPVCLITKCFIPDEALDSILRARRNGLPVLVYLSYSGLGPDIERGIRHDELRANFPRLHTAGIPVIHYWRPFLPQNSHPDILQDVLDLVRQYAKCSVTVGTKVKPSAREQITALWPGITEAGQDPQTADSVWPRTAWAWLRQLPGRCPLDEVFGLAGLEPLLKDPQIENINVTGERTFVRYADGRRERLPPVVGSDAELVQLIRDLAARSGIEERRFDRGSPGVGFQLPCGERAFAVMAVTARPSLSICRHRFRRVTLAQLREGGTIDAGLEGLLAAMVRARKNILVTGGTGIGKTTLLRALASEIPPWERLVTIEDVFELGLEADG